jgi:hypothetical protein
MNDEPVQAVGADEVECEPIYIKCMEKDCTEEFAFEPGEQRFYASKGYPPPKRCAAHRILQRERMAKREEEAKRKESPFHQRNWK